VTCQLSSAASAPVRNEITRVNVRRLDSERADTNDVATFPCIPRTTNAVCILGGVGRCGLPRQGRRAQDTLRRIHTKNTVKPVVLDAPTS
jgi:hypothetical protein